MLPFFSSSPFGNEVALLSPGLTKPRVRILSPFSPLLPFYFFLIGKKCLPPFSFVLGNSICGDSGTTVFFFPLDCSSLGLKEGADLLPPLGDLGLQLGERLWVFFPSILLCNVCL